VIIIDVIDFIEPEPEFRKYQIVVAEV